MFFHHVALTPCVVIVFTGFAGPHDNPLFTLSPGAHDQHDQHDLSGSYSQLSHHAFQQYQLGGAAEGHSLKSDSGLMTGASLWETENVIQAGNFLGASVRQAGSSQAGVTELHCCLHFLHTNVQFA